MPKGGAKLKANFTTPLVPKSSVKGSASGGEGGEGVKGEKSKNKKDVVSRATGGCGGGDSSSDEQQGVSVRQCLTKKRLDDLCRHLGDGRGECVIVVYLLVFCCCCAGVNRCKVCKERCCALVNDVINILIEYGKIDPDAEVNIV